VKKELNTEKLTLHVCLQAFETYWTC